VECQFSVERSEIKVTGRQNPKKLRDIWRTCLLTGGSAPGVRRRLQTRPDPLLGLIYCRRLGRSATGRTAAYHVGTRRQHLLLVSIACPV